MKKIYNYILLSVWAFLAVGCIEEEFNNDIPSAESGDEVQFGLSLGDPKTRTEYGTEDNGAFPIYWIAGDKVQIFCPQGLEDRKSAEYQVTIPDNGDKAYYAKALTKTGDVGIQWGDGYEVTDEDNNITSGLHDFYSLYPSGNYTLSIDGTKAEGITINYTQNIVVDGTSVKSDMEDCLMYAHTEGVTRGDNVVNLHYDPISTVLWLTLKVAANKDTKEDSFTIQSISVEADADIAGTFSLNIADGKFDSFVTGKSSKTVLAQITNPSTGGYHTLTNNESLSIPLFLAPIDKLNVKAWKIQVVANNNTYTKTLGIDKTLVPGQIHKITLPELKPETTEWQVENWMTNIPRNVYLSEVSIPGSWNSLNPEFQGATPSITTQYNNGVRGFHLDTRWKRSGSYGNYTYTLGTANGGNTSEVVSDGRVMTDSDNPTFVESLAEITSNVKDDEYMVLICTFAQGSYNYTDSNNGTWIDAISTACANNGDVYDAKALTANTLVGDVLGKVIVIINSEGEISSTPSGSKCLFVNIPLKLTSSLFGSSLSANNIGVINKGTESSTDISDTGIDMYNTQAQVCIAGDEYTDSRDRSNVDGRGFAPTFGERKTVANNILSWSRTNYGTPNYAHDKWIYLGLGGYYVEYSSGFIGIGAGWKAADEGHANVASDLNGWIDGKVSEMGTTPSGQSTVIPYYPVGIVLMNYVNDYAATVKKILMLNNKYPLQYDPNKPTDYKPVINSAAASYSSGMNDQGVSAFGWE